MVSRHLYKISLSSLLGAAFISAPVNLSFAQTVGTAGAVNPLTQSTPPGGATKQVTLGSQVIFKERFVTSPQGSLQLTFLDKSTLNIGPNSDVVINEYVYDPSTRDGKMSVGLAKGALRFVGGQISHNGNVEIKTPVVTIGLRGAVAVVSYDPLQQSSSTSSIVGTMTVTSSAGGTVTMVQGYTTTVGQGQPPAPPSRTPPQILANVTGQATSQPGQTGGSIQSPSNQSANTQLAGNLSQAPAVLANTTSTNQVAQQTSSTNQRVTDTRQTTQVTSTTTAVTPISGQGTTGQTPSTSPPTTPSGPPPSTPSPITPSVVAYTVGGAGAGGPVPYLTALFVGPTQVFTTPLLGYRFAGDASTQNTETVRTFQVGFGINGRGASQSSLLFVAGGDFFGANQSTIFSGTVAATAREDATLRTGIALSSIASVPGSVQLAGNGSLLPISASVNQNNLDQNNNVFSGSAREAGGQISGQGNNYTFTQTITRTSTPAGLGANRPSLTLKGYAAGILETRTADASDVRTGTQFLNAVGQRGDGSDVTLRLDPRLARGSVDINLGSASTGSRLLTGTYQLGSLDPTAAPRSAYVDTDNFALGSRAALTAPFTSSVGNGNYSAENASFTSYNTIVGNNSGAAQALAAATDITPCVCEFTQWGFWSTRSVRGLPGGGTDEERGNLLLWAAGQLADPSIVPNIGSATYNGHIIGNVQAGTGTIGGVITDNGTSYLAGGSFQHTVNFANGTGNVNFTFDQRNFSGSTNLHPSNRTNFSGNFSAATGSGLTATGQLQGSFYGPNTGVGTAPLEQGGQFNLSGQLANSSTVYNAAGIFAARR